MSTDAHDQPGPLARKRLCLLVAALTVAIVAIALSGCGGSTAKSTTSSANAAKADGGGSNRFASLRTCLQKQGINLPSAPAGGGGQPGAGGLPGAGTGGFRPPAGTSQTKFQEALKKCGGGNFPGGTRRGGTNTATARKALTRYAQCMRENRVNLPTPNMSGSGPVFNTKGIDTSAATFKSAQKKCQSQLQGAFGASRPPAGGGVGGSPPEGGGGSPPSSEEAG